MNAGGYFNGGLLSKMYVIVMSEVTCVALMPTHLVRRKLDFPHPDSDTPVFASAGETSSLCNAGLGTWKLDLYVATIVFIILCYRPQSSNAILVIKMV